MKYIKIITRLFSLFIIFVSVTAITCGFITNDILYYEQFYYYNDKIEDNFDNFKAIILTDMHNHSLEYENGYLIDMVNEKDPDVIFILGDMIDQYTKQENIDAYKIMFDEFSSYPIYFVHGNHEGYANCIDEFFELLNSYSNIQILYDQSTQFFIGGQHINIFGVHDPYYDNHDSTTLEDVNELMEPVIKELSEQIQDDSLNIMLAHRPSLADLSHKYGMDLILSGHTHGGQVSFFPPSEYTIDGQKNYISGRYDLGDQCSLFVSNGMGFNGKLPVRVNSPMQLFEIVLKADI